MSFIDPVDIVNVAANGKGGGLLGKFIAFQNPPDLKYPAVEYPPLPEPPPPPPEPPQPDLVIDFGTSAITVGISDGGPLEILRFRLRSAAQPLDMLETFLGRRRDLPKSSLADNYDLSPVMDREFDSAWDFHPCLKRRIEWLARAREGGGWEAEATLDVAAVCYRALQAAVDSRDRPATERLNDKSRVYLAVPNTFPRRAVEVVSDGVAYAVAALTGTEERARVRTVLEAEAVAYGELGKDHIEERPVETGSVLIVDAGAGTTDATIVRVDGDALKVVAHAGLPVGGLDLDAFIASQRADRQDLSTLSPIDLSSLLREVREQKHVHWTDAGPGTGGEEAWERQSAALAQHLSESRGFESQVNGRPLAEVLAAGHRRYLALAVHGLLGALPGEELAQVSRVVVSGRASLVMGFRASVEAALVRLRDDRAEGVRYTVPRRDDAKGRERKFAVLRGLYTFARGGFNHSRLPVRATFDVILRRCFNQELLLVSAGLPLVDGWGVRAWHHPVMLHSQPEQKHIVAVRLIPRAVLRDLVGAGFFDEEELEAVLDWSAINVLLFDRSPPFSARVSYNFFNLEVGGEIDGEPFRAPPPSSGRHLHPVHHQPEDWFELYHTQKGMQP